MCGITGIFDKDSRYDVSKERVLRMMEKLDHRGPDDLGYYIDGQIGLGFKRLSIVDMVTGNQPMFNEDRSLVLICNGEIYNYVALKKELMRQGHVFYSECDVEVILHLYESYGADCLNMINGQFAFCIFDRNRKTLFIARDQVGIAPLFYTFQNNVFTFASEIKALLAHPSVTKRLNLTGLDQIITFPGMVSPTTMFDKIHSLPPGHFLIFDGEDLAVTEYWDLTYPPEGEEAQGGREEDYVAELNEILTRSVSYRLHADVPVGYYLSGGLDSSLIAGLVNELSDQTSKSFSVSFGDDMLDEKKYRKAILPALRSTHHEITFDPKDIGTRLSDAVYFSEAPLKETYNTCSLALSEAVRKNNIKVVLSGEGADELFGGYIGYRLDAHRANGRSGRHDCDEMLERELRHNVWGIDSFMYEKNYQAYGDIKRSLYSEELNGSFDQFDSVREGIVDKKKLKGRSNFHIRSYLDFKFRVADHLCADHGDRMAYANSIEARYPYLDIDLVEFMKRLPMRFKFNSATEKYILKKCAGKYLPSAIVDREKFSFVAPGSHYLLNQDLEWVNDMLSYDRIKRQGIFNPDIVENLKRIYRSKNFSLNQTFETDLLMIVLTSGIFLDVFQIKHV